MSKITPPDAPAREKIERELATNFLVEAGAGSGKTTSLVKRMVALVKNGRFRVGEIAAITFTRKAAAELKERFQNQVEAACREAAGREARLLENALLDLDRCFIGTIHSFCAALLRERPVEAGLDPEFRELDELQERLLREEAWSAFLAEVRTKRQELLERLQKTGLTPGQLKSGFYTLSCYPDVEPVCSCVPQPDLKAALKKVEALARRAAAAIPQREPEKGYDNLQKAVLKTLRYLRYFDLSREKNLAEILTTFEKEPNVTQNRWNSREEAKQFRQEFADLAVDVVAPVMRQWREYCHYHALAFLQEAVKFYAGLRYEKSTLTFEDLLVKTAGLLKNHPEVRRYFQDKYKCLLVDEFQDTDPVQAEIMFYLTGSDVEEKDWQKLVPRPGSLFVVGDPKQSIYRFRRADIDMYNLVKELLLASGAGEVLKLTANFRSLNVLGEFLNPVFQKLLPAGATAYQAEFSPLETVLPGNERAAAGVRVLDIPAEFGKKGAIAEADAEYIARYISWALNGNIRLARSPAEIEAGLDERPRPQDFLVILRRKGDLDVYARALERYGVPVTMTGGSSLEKSLELNELLKLLQCLRDPTDPVALVAVLRGLFFGFSDTSLYRFKNAGGVFHLLAPLPEDLDEGLRDAFKGALGKLGNYYAWSRSLPPAAALEKIVLDLGLIPYTLSLPLGKSKCGHVMHVLEFMRRAEAGGATCFHRLVEELATVLGAGVEEELNISGGTEDAVRLMNLHKAKGLEAPVVFLALPYAKEKNDIEKHVTRVGRSTAGYFALGERNRFGYFKVLAQPPEWEEKKEEERKYLAAEEVRLLYVAATRARNLLVVSRSLKYKDLKYNPWAPLFREGGSEIEPLTIPDGIKTAAAETVPGARLPEEPARDLASWQERAAEPTFALSSPTELARREEVPQMAASKRAGRGTAWGSAVHRVLEALVGGSADLDAAVAAALRENGLPGSMATEIRDVLRIFEHSGLWQRLLQSPQKLAEVPFSLPVDGRHPLCGQLGLTGELPVIFTGVIDLVFKEGDSWVVVDYKTDSVREEGEINKLVERYALQVSAYCLVWEALTGAKVGSGELYLTGPGRSVKVFG